MFLSNTCQFSCPLLGLSGPAAKTNNQEKETTTRVPNNRLRNEIWENKLLVHDLEGNLVFPPAFFVCWPQCSDPHLHSGFLALSAHTSHCLIFLYCFTFESYVITRLMVHQICFQKDSSIVCHQVQGSRKNRCSEVLSRYRSLPEACSLC